MSKNSAHRGALLKLGSNLAEGAANFINYFGESLVHGGGC
jgi:hypothetical protein